MDTDVIIVGAGPTGLMLASELRLGGAAVTVFEKRTERSWESRGVGFTARATEIFHQRGLLERLDNAEISRQGHFGGIPMDYGVLEGSHFGVRGVPQYKIEEMLEKRALELGVSLCRGHEVTGLHDTGETVVAITDGPAGRVEHSAAYLVGCDGGRSIVRQLAGFDFPGSDATREMYLADVTGCDIRPRMIGELVPNGMVMAGPLEKGYFRVIVCENGTPPPTKNRQLTFADVADAWQRLTGESIHGGQARWVSSFTDATRQVTEYRRGRVLLAGDAAHIHLPAGGQGLSVGVQDAVNLGWKLAATVRGWAPGNLLDTYHSERHPVGARVLRNTRAQGTLNLSGKEVEPLRAVMTDLIAIPAVARHLSGMVSGLDIRYDVGVSGHPLLGMRMPDRPLELPDGGREQVARLLHPARGIIISANGFSKKSLCPAGWSDRVDIVRVTSFPSGPEDNGPGDNGTATEAALIRPDGYVAWAAPGAGQLTEALHRWFGSPRDPAETRDSQRVASSALAGSVVKPSHERLRRQETVATSVVRNTEHEVDVGAPAARVYALLADVGAWPEIFPPTVHAERVDQNGTSELIRIWATANGTARTWTSRRQHDPERMSIEFRQERSQHPVGGMGGRWVVQPVSASECHVLLLHDFYAASGDPADLDWIGQAVDRNSAAELSALRARAELAGPEDLFTFEDTVEVDGSAEDVYDFLNEAQLWQQRLPHVARVSLEEETSGLQVLEMDTRTTDGSVHTTKSVRVCQAHRAIVYKQTVLPPLMALHTGRWLIQPRDPAGVRVTSRHTVRINTARIPELLGAGADLPTAQEIVRKALSANSLITLRAAKTYAEGSGGGREVP